MGDGSTRHASRVLLFDPRGRILLFLEEFPDFPGQGRWCTPGGGAEPGEGAEAAGIRELHEETGLLVTSLGPIVHEARFEVRRPSARHSYAHWTFFVHLVDQAFEPAREGWTAEERRTVKDTRWWQLDELLASGERYAPDDLPALIERFRPAR